MKQLKTMNESLDFDGLNTIDYKIVSVQLKPLFTHLMVDYDEKRIVESVKARMNNAGNKKKITFNY